MASSPIFRRITLTEVKKTSNKRGSLLRELAGLEKEERDILKNHHDPSYSNWRASFLLEGGMNTSGFMQTTLSAQGDTNLETIEGNVEASYQAYEGGSDALSNTAITASGTGSGSDGGFDLGKNYLGFNGDSTPRYAALKPVDASKFDTIVVTGIRGNDNNGGEDPDETDEDLMIYYQLPGQNTIQRLDYSGGVQQSGVEYKIIPIGSDDSGLKDWSLGLPSYARAENIRFILYQPSHHGVGFDNYGITQINYRRKSPLTVFVSLDSPEASSFMRIGSPSKSSQSKKQREKQLREQLEASKDYTDKKFGENFPGSTTPAPGDEDPTEQAKRAPGLGEYEPEVVDYNSWKQDIEKEDPQAKTSKADYTKWKDEKLLKSFANVRDKQLLTPPDQAAETPVGKSFDDMKMDQQPRPEPSDSKLASFSTSAKSSTPIGGEGGTKAILGADAAMARKEPVEKPSPAEVKVQNNIEKETETVNKEIEKETETLKKEVAKSETSQDSKGVLQNAGEKFKNWFDKSLDKLGQFYLNNFATGGTAAYDIAGYNNLLDGTNMLVSNISSLVDTALNPIRQGIILPIIAAANNVPVSVLKDEMKEISSAIGKVSNNISIARSIFSGKVTPHVPNAIELRQFAQGITPDMFTGDGDAYGDGGPQIAISDQRYEYADDNIYVENGEVKSNKDGTRSVRANQPYVGLKEHGKGYAQVVIPKDGGAPYVHYYDYNYHNLNSPDAMEVTQIPVTVGGKTVNFNPQQFLSDFTHLTSLMAKSPLGGGVNRAISTADQNFIDTFKNLGTADSFMGGGWPKGIHGAALTDFKIPYTSLPPETQAMIEQHPLYFDRKVDGLDPNSKEFRQVEMDTYLNHYQEDKDKASNALRETSELQTETFPQLEELAERNRVAKEEHEATQKEATSQLGDVLKRKVDLANYQGFKHGDPDYKGNINMYVAGNIDKAAAQDIAKLSNVDLGEVDKLMKDYDLSTRRNQSPTAAVNSDYTWAKSQPEYIEAQKRFDDAWKNDTLTRSIELAPGKIMLKFVKERREASQRLYDISDEAEKNIKKVYDELGDELDRLNKIAITYFTPERLPPELEASMKRWFVKTFNKKFYGKVVRVGILEIHQDYQAEQDHLKILLVHWLSLLQVYREMNKYLLRRVSQQILMHIKILV